MKTWRPIDLAMLVLACAVAVLLVIAGVHFAKKFMEQIMVVVLTLLIFYAGNQFGTNRDKDKD